MLLSDIVTLANAESFHSAARRFADLRLTLEQEMQELEKQTFPLLGQEASSSSGVQMLLEGHYLIHQLLNSLGSALSENDAPRVERSAHQLDSSLGIHRAAERGALSRLRPVSEG